MAGHAPCLADVSLEALCPSCRTLHWVSSLWGGPCGWTEQRRRRWQRCPRYPRDQIREPPVRWSARLSMSHCYTHWGQSPAWLAPVGLTLRLYNSPPPVGRDKNQLCINSIYNPFWKYWKATASAFVFAAHDVLGWEQMMNEIIHQIFSFHFIFTPNTTQPWGEQKYRNRHSRSIK